MTTVVAARPTFTYESLPVDNEYTKALVSQYETLKATEKAIATVRENRHKEAHQVGKSIVQEAMAKGELPMLEFESWMVGIDHAFRFKTGCEATFRDTITVCVRLDWGGDKKAEVRFEGVGSIRMDAAELQALELEVLFRKSILAAYKDGKRQPENVWAKVMEVVEAQRAVEVETYEDDYNVSKALRELKREMMIAAYVLNLDEEGRAGDPNFGPKTCDWSVLSRVFTNFAPKNVKEARELLSESRAKLVAGGWSPKEVA